VAGFALPHSIQRIDVAGRDVTEYLQLLLRKSGHNFNTSAEMEVVKDIKEKMYLLLFVLSYGRCWRSEREQDRIC
jgi:actin-related protein